MVENEKGKSQKQGRPQTTANPTSDRHAEGASAQGSDAPGETNSAAHRAQHSQPKSRNFLGRLTVSEWLTFFVGCGSLVVSYLTYKNATDTSDLKAAVGNLSSLATETHKQAIAMQAQAKAMQGQLDQMALAQRGWLTVSAMRIDLINNFTASSGIVVFGQYNITNLGHSPVQNISINTGLFFKGVDRVDHSTVRALCGQQPSAEDLATGLISYINTILPGQAELVSGFPSSGTAFARERGYQGLDKAVTPDAPNLGLIPILAGCISYKSALDEGWHHTGFAFQAIIQTGNVPYQADMFPGIPLGIQIDTQKRGEVPIPPDLRIIPYPGGNFAD